MSLRQQTLDGVHSTRLRRVRSRFLDTERRLVQLQDLYIAVCQTGQALMHTRDARAMPQKVCEIAVRYGKFALALISQWDEAAACLVMVAAAGPALERLSGFQLRVDPGDPKDDGPTATCLREERSVVDQDLHASASLGTQLRALALQAGIHSGGVFPLRRNGRVVGTLNLYSDQIAFFDSDRLALLEQMAGDLAFALERADAEELRRKADEQLMATCRRMEDLKAAVDEAAIVLVADAKGIITYANQRAGDISGYAPEELVGQDFRFLTSTQQTSPFFEQMWDIISVGGIWRGEIRNRSRGGSVFWLDTTVVPFLDETGSPIQHMSISFEITARKQAEAKLLASSADRRSLLDAASVARMVPWSMDIKTGSLKVGDSVFMVLGQPAAGFQSRQGALKELLKPEDQKLLTHALATAKAGGYASFEAPMKRGEHQIIWTRWTIARQEGYLQGVIQDITEQHELHAQLLQSQKLESLGTLVGGITHDFNNILMGILGYTEVLSHNPAANASVQKGVDVIRRAAERGRNLVNQLLKFSRRNLSSMTMANLNDAVREILDLVKRPGDDRLTLEVSLEADLPESLMDASQITQVVLNLAVNARDAIPGQGTIRLTTGQTVLEPELARTRDRRPGPCVYLDVEDTGSGIPSELQSRIFEPFFTTKAPGKGTGLGLSVAHGIVEAHGGLLLCESRPGVGTRFRMLLPLVTTQTLDDSERDLQLPTTARILLLDDPGTPRSTAAELLTYMGHSVISLDSLEKALEGHHQAPFQLVIVNLDMAHGKGGSLLSALQTAMPNVPFLAAGHDPHDHAWMKGLKRQPRAVLRWPLHSVELLAAIQRVLV